MAELRFLLAWRRLRGRGGTAEGVAQLLLFVLALPASVVFAGLVAVGSYRAARAGSGLAATVPISLILYGVWQTWTAVSLTVSERDAIDLRRLLPYPIPALRLYLIGIGTGLVGDPFALLWMVLLLGMLGGAAAGRPGAWLLLLAALLALFAAATVAVVTLAQELLARLARSRRWRELAVVAAVVGWLLLVFATSGGPHALKLALPVLRQLRWALVPAALSSEAAARLYAGQPASALPWAAALAVTALAAGLLAYRLGLATALSGGESARVAVPEGAGARRSLVPEVLGPLFEKELRSLTRHPAARVYLLLLPALAALVGSKVPVRRGGELAELLRALPLFGLAAYVHLAFQIFWVNGLGFERGGVRTIFLAPVLPQRVIAAKNAAVFVCTTGYFGVAAAAYLATAGPQPPWAVASAFVLELGLAPVLYGLGNVVGIVIPRPAPLGLQRSGSMSPLAALAAMAITSAALATFAVPVLVAVRLDALWVVPAAWSAVAVAATVAWWYTLPATGRLLERRREQVLVSVCGDDV